MNKLQLLLQVLLISSVALFISSCTEDEPLPPIIDPVNIADIIEDTEHFSTLFAALQKTDLVATLDGTTKYTIFAPNNDAFDTYLNGTSLDDIDTDVLKELLLNHVILEDLISTDLTNEYISTLASGPNATSISLLVNTDNGILLNSSVNVITRDIVTDNGTIHEVDQLIRIPNIADLLIQGEFDSLLIALIQPGLATDFVGTLRGDGPFTLFAPSNTAFETLINDNATWNSISDIPSATLEQILSYHVVFGINGALSTLTNGQTLTSLEGGELIINTTGQSVSVTDANGNFRSSVVKDIQGSNGVVHLMNGVLML